jgi:hypothetical protein
VYLVFFNRPQNCHVEVTRYDVLWFEIPNRMHCYQVPFGVGRVPDTTQPLLEQLVDEDLALLRDHERNGHALNIDVLAIAVDPNESIALAND